MNNVAFGKVMENVRKYRDMNTTPQQKEKTLFGVKTKFYTTKFFWENLLETEIKKTWNTYEQNLI